MDSPTPFPSLRFISLSSSDESDISLLHSSLLCVKLESPRVKLAFFKERTSSSKSSFTILVMANSLWRFAYFTFISVNSSSKLSFSISTSFKAACNSARSCFTDTSSVATVFLSKETSCVASAKESLNFKASKSLSSCAIVSLKLLTSSWRTRFSPDMTRNSLR